MGKRKILWDDSFYVKNDEIVNPPKKIEEGLFGFKLKNADTAILVLIESVKQYAKCKEVRGAFLDGETWYTFYTHLWEDSEKTAHIRFSPNVMLPGGEHERGYKAFLEAGYPR